MNYPAYLLAFLRTSLRLAPIRVYDSDTSDFVGHGGVVEQGGEGSTSKS